uniref:Putative secreted protein n=1 Tax=Ixodes ricinus TaxID=34613 RepID=A0A6B0UMD2_IXORI
MGRWGLWKCPLFTLCRLLYGAIAPMPKHSAQLFSRLPRDRQGLILEVIWKSTFRKTIYCREVGCGALTLTRRDLKGNPRKMSTRSRRNHHSNTKTRRKVSVKIQHDVAQAVICRTEQ